MNPIVVIMLLLVGVGLVWIGRSGPQKAGAYMRRNRGKIGGASLLAIAGVMTVRGLWEPALIPAALGWWLISDRSSKGPFGSLLKSYLDRRMPGRGDHMHRDADPGRSQRVARAGVMTEEEAYEVLGLQFGESREAITAAYRAAMKKVHPDQGGAPDLAVRLNQARDLLLRRQR